MSFLWLITQFTLSLTWIFSSLSENRSAAFGLFLSNYAIANENLLTLKQQLDRLQRDVNDLSKSVYNKSFEPSDSSNQTEETVNFSAIDIRIYDLETDIKNLTLSFEELTFQLDDVLNSLSSLEQNINFQIDKIILSGWLSNCIWNENLKLNNYSSWHFRINIFEKMINEIVTYELFFKA